MDADTGTGPDTRLPRVVATPRGEITVRRASPADLPAVSRMHRRCSTDTVFRRYFSAAPAISEAVQERLLQTRLALVAQNGHEVVGLAHLLDATGRPIELALLVEDGWQRFGVGLTLAEVALDVADAWGIDVVVTYSLQTSTAAHSLMRRLRQGALHPQFHQDGDGVVRTDLPLRASGLRGLTA